MRCPAVIFMLVLLNASAFASVLSDAANAMKAGEWREIGTLNIAPVLANTGGASGMTFGYTEDIVWDPRTRALYYAGSDHFHDTGYPRFITYSESTNTWTELPRPSWFPSLTATAMHGYDHNAIVPDSGWFFHRPFSSRNWYRYHIPSRTWTQMPVINSTVFEYNNCCVGVEYFPELNSIILASLESGTNGSLIRFSFATNQWVRVGPGKNLPMGGLHNFAECNPVHHVAVFGGGNGSSSIYKVNAQGVITALKQTPFSVGVQQTVFTVDPVSGDYLVFNNSNQFWVYDVVADSWAQQAVTAPIFTTYYGTPVHGVVATPVSTYGVNLFVTCNSGDCKVRLYKHSAGSAADRAALPAAAGFSVSPNPARDRASIFLPGAVSAGIYTIRGKLAADLSPALRQGDEKLEWDTGRLPAGVYLLKAITEKGIHSKRILVQK